MDDENLDNSTSAQTKKRVREDAPKWFLDYVKSQKTSNNDSEYDYTTNSDEDYTDNDSIELNLSNKKDYDADYNDENDYFDKDFSKIKNTIIKNIMHNLTKDQQEALINKIKNGVNTAFEILQEAIEEKFEQLMEQQPTSNLWKLGMGPNDIKKYTPIIKELREGINKETITVQKILDANIDKKSKAKLLQTFDILQNLDPYSADYISIQSSINNIIENADKSPYTKAQLDEFKQKEKELEKFVGLNEPLKMRIINAPIDMKRKAVIYEKYLMLEKNPEDSVTSASIEEWIEEALKTPYTVMKPNMTTVATPGECLLKIKKQFESKMSDMNIVLEPLLTVFNNRLNNPNASNLVIGFLGSPGTGKTFCSKLIADALDMPFHQISLGGILDSSILDGQHPGWVGSSPGRFVKALQEMGVINGVLFLDEIDKLGETPAGLQVQYSLLHSIDPTQNHSFHDHYLGSKLPIDLSKCLIICALNKTDGLDPALLNRLSIIHVPDYTIEQKKNILRQHLFPNALIDANLTTNDVQLTDEGYDEILNIVNSLAVIKEGGVRGIKNCIKTIVNKLSLLLRITADEREQLALSFKIDKLDELKSPLKITKFIVNELFPSKNNKTTYDHMYL